MSERAAGDSDSDFDTIDITEYSQRSKKLKNSKSAWTNEVPKTLREEIEVAEAEASFYQGILDVIIAHLDPNIETEDVERIVLPPRVPSDVRKKLRKYRVEAKNIVEFIDDKIGDESDDDKGNEDEKAEATFLTTLIEKLCVAVKQDSISSKFKLPRVPVVEAERKDRLKDYRKDGIEIVECLKRLKIHKIDKVAQTDFPEKEREVTQTRVTEYIESKSTQNVPQTKKIRTRARQTQTDFDDHTLGKATVMNTAGEPHVRPPSYSTVITNYDVTQEGLAVARPGQAQNSDFLKTVRGQQDLLQQQDPSNQPRQHNQQFGQQQQQQQRISNVVHDNVHNQHPDDSHAMRTEGGNGESDQLSYNSRTRGGASPNPGAEQTHRSESNSDFYRHFTQNGGALPQKPTDKSSEDYINMMEAHILRLSCQVSMLESQLHDSQRSLVVTAYANDDVLDRVSNTIQSSDQRMTGDDVQPVIREMSDLADKHRPIKIADNFAKLYDREWIDVFRFETTDMKKSEPNAIADILEIIQSVYQMCIRLTQEQIEDWQVQIQTSRRSELPEFLRDIRKLKDDALFTSLRKIQIGMAEDSIPNIRQEIASNEAFTSFYGPELASCERFVFACVDVCWLMSVREPPMFLDFTCKNGSKFNKEVYSFYTKTGNKVNYLVWPPIYIYENGQLLHKGVVQPQ
ncbi:uncharacterized protein LOC117328768 [Pecten maximus]|uniref:uncharacterized protein LOC117328768 n=1 Tax=Pecten maximus TaxID=6579 RepID=UPI0014586566|nr:uncharacterized protein LOC117328768 [Pecten maximus]